MKTLLVGLMILFVVPFVLADENKLEIIKITAYVDGDKDTGTVDIKPGSTLEIKVKLENLFDEDIGDLDIEDIVVTVTIDEIDDGDELEEESDEFDLNAEEKDTVTIEFEIPWEVDDDSFDVLIDVEGEDENGTMHYATDELTVRVKKESHELLIRRAVLSNTNLKCSRTTQLSFSVMNLGKDNEDVTLTIFNDELELNKQDSFELDDDPFDSDSKYSSTYPLVLDKEQEAGIYPITVRVEYSGEAKEEIVELTVQECPLTAAKKEPEEEEEETTVVVQQPEVTTPPPAVTGDVVATTEEAPSFVSQNMFIILLGLLDLLIIVVGVVLLVRWTKKR